VLRLIEMTIRASIKFNKPISVCGEMAGDSQFTRLLMGFGLRQFSMHPTHVLAVKREVLQSDLSQFATLTKKILNSNEIAKIEPLLNKLNS
jgi:phosphotransferase system enzyme I (PtsI)